MSKGIRPAVNAKFMELSPKRLAGEFGPIDTPLAAGNTKFRRTIMDYAMEQFSITNAAAATAYNTARIKCAETNPELVVGLGRPEDKKGGRKPKVAQAEVVDPVTGEPLTQEQIDAAPGDTQAEETTPVEPAEPVAEVVQKIRVVRAKDGEFVAEFDTMEEAQAAIDKNAKAKKAKLVVAGEAA